MAGLYDVPRQLAELLVVLAHVCRAAGVSEYIADIPGRSFRKKASCS